MANTIDLFVEEPDRLLNAGAYGTGALMRVQFCATETGTYADIAGTGSTPTVALVAGDRAYVAYDPAGTVGIWYRTRYENAGGTRLSDWSTPFQVDAPASYATLADLLERIQLPDDTHYELVAQILEAVSAQFDQECGRQFYRIPRSTGTTARLYDGDGGSVLRLPEGCVSLTTVEVAGSMGGSYTTLAANEWRLRPAYPAPGWPYTELILTELASTVFTDGTETVRLTGVFGWSTVPLLVREAVLQLAQLTFNMALTRAGGSIGLTEFGGTTLPSQRPDAWYRAMRAYGRRAGVAV